MRHDVSAIIERARQLFDDHDVDGAATLLNELAVAPESVEAADRLELLGRIATAQRRPDDAVSHFERALQIRATRHGKSSVEAARGHGVLARHYLVTGEYERGLNAAKLAVKLSKSDPEWLVLHGELARGHGDMSGAEASFTGALKKLRGAARIPALRGLGNLYILQGNGKKAKQRFEQALALVDADESYDAAILEGVLGQALNLLGDSEVAVKHFERSHTLLVATAGETHEDVAICLNNLALAAAAFDNHKAIEATRQAVEINERGGRGDHPFQATALNNLAYFHSEVGEPAEAVVHAERALAIFEKCRAPWHFDIALTLSNLANYHRELGRDDLALARARQLAGQAAELAKTEQEIVAGVLFSTGTLMLELGRDPGKALELYTAALCLRERLLARDDDDDEGEDEGVLNTAYNAAARLFVAGAIDQAIAILEGAASRWTGEDNLEILAETIEAVRAGDRETVLQGTELDESEEDGKDEDEDDDDDDEDGEDDDDDEVS